MSYKTILVRCDASKSATHRLGVAAELAERFGAHLIGLYARWPIEPPLYFDIGGGKVIDEVIKSYQNKVEADKAAASAAFANAAKGHRVSTEWQVASGFVGAQLSKHACYADLVVVSQAEAEPAIAPADLPEVVAVATGRPVIVVPRIGAQRPIGKVVMLCWNASREATRAASDALPFLKAADQVIVLVVEPKGAGAAQVKGPGADAAAWLGRHGVRATVEREVAPDADIGSVILSRAADSGVDLIVMGIYGHSRMWEFVMGGVSRTVLASMTVPVFMAH